MCTHTQVQYKTGTQVYYALTLYPRKTSFLVVMEGLTLEAKYKE